TPEQLKIIHVEEPLEVLAPGSHQSATDAYARVLADAGATLPSRDPVDFRIMTQVRTGAGKVIQKETDLPPEQRWPKYYSLPKPVDSDNDGIPDYWEEQFGLNPHDATDAMRTNTAGRYANVEHYFNNTDPTGGS